MYFKIIGKFETVLKTFPKVVTNQSYYLNLILITLYLGVCDETFEKNERIFK